MTVIFHTNAGARLLGGDMLLSVPWSPSLSTQAHDLMKDLKIPSQPYGIKIQTQSIPNFVPILMRRKLCLVNGSLAVGVAGSVSLIRPFLDDMYQTFSNLKDFTRAQVTEILEKHDSDELEAILLTNTTDWNGALIHPERQTIDSKRFGNVAAIGSGARNIIDEIKRLEQYEYGRAQSRESDNQFSEFPMLSQNLILLANIYWREFLSPDNIFEAWGGAYDIIYEDSNRKFQYLEDYSIFFWLYDVERADDGVQLSNVLKYERRPDVSLISMLVDGQLRFFGSKDITEPDVPTSVKIDTGSFTMNSSIHISIFQVCRGSRYLMPIVQIDGLDPTGKTKQTVFTWLDESNRLCVAFRSDHAEWINQQLEEYAKRLSS